MKNILLVGDSIRIGYDKSVKKSLEGLADVYYPAENCRFSSYVLRYLHEYKSLVPDKKVDLIHWNAGLWDCLRLFGEEPHTPPEIYAYYIERICERIKKVFPDAKVVFATSTSVISERMSPDFKRYNEEIEAYNKTAVEIVTRFGFEVNDLYAVSTSLSEADHSDAVHYYTPSGTEAFTRAVLSVICPLLDIEKLPEYKEVLHVSKPIGI